MMSKTLRTRIFFENGKKATFSKISGYVWTGLHYFRIRVDKQKRFENATCGRGVFSKMGEKKLRFQKYPDTCERGLIN